MMNLLSYLLPTLVLLPAVGAAVIFTLARNEPTRGVRLGALFAGIALLLGVVLTSRLQFSTNEPERPIAPRILWSSPSLPAQMLTRDAGSADLRFQLGLDAPAAAMVLLTGIVVFSILLVVPRQVREGRTDYAALLLLAESALFGAFLAMDVLSFYIFFELTLLPILPLMIRWGGTSARQAALKFLLFTLAGSLPMMAGLAALVVTSSDASHPLTLSMPVLAERAHAAVSDIGMTPTTPALAFHDSQTQRWIFSLLLLGLGIKMAILPLHTWLPGTYLASHTTTTALLAAVVLKLGVFGMLRLLLPMLPDAAASFGPTWGIPLGATAVVYGAVIALSQRDLRLLLAYGSLGHVGFITMGLFSLSEEGIAGATLQMANHGLTTAALFLIVGMIFQRTGSFDWRTTPAALAGRFPRFAVLFVFFTLANVGMPGLNNFVGEVLALAGTMQHSFIWTAVASSGLVLGAWYALSVVERLWFGRSTVPTVSASLDLKDLRRSETAALLPLAAACLFIGVYPNAPVQALSRDASALARIYRFQDDAALTQTASADRNVALETTSK